MAQANSISDKVFNQFIAIRDSGLVNMFHMTAVIEVARGYQHRDLIRFVELYGYARLLELVNERLANQE